MGGLGWVGFEILWSEPNTTYYQKKFSNPTQPNPTHQALKTDPTQRVGLGWVRSGWSWQVDYTPLLTTHTNNTYKPHQRNSQSPKPQNT